MLRVGLTGNIGTGKSTVSGIFAELGVPVVDADEVVHELLSAGTAVTQAVCGAFGAGMLLPDGSVDRRRLGELVFGAPEKLRLLNSLVHPAVRAAVSSRLDAWAESRVHRMAVVEAALLVETGYYRQFDRLIVVVCTPEQQAARIARRDGLSCDQIRARMASQLPSEEKARVADFVVDNSGSLEETRRQVAGILTALMGAESDERKSPRRIPDLTEDADRD